VGRGQRGGGPEGRVYNILRIDGQTNRTHNKAAVLELVVAEGRRGCGGGVAGGVNGGEESFFGSLRSVAMIDFPATESKFVIRREPTLPARSAARRYFTLASEVTPAAVALGTVYARNHLVVAVSVDLLNWTVCDTLLVDDTGLPDTDSARYTGFHYIDAAGDDILYAPRTGYRGSNSFHNANRMTVKRLLGFARVCEWQQDYVLVGLGWCRPASGFSEEAGRFVIGERHCAGLCSANASCAAFAKDQRGGCVLYPANATASSGDLRIACYTKRAP